MGELIKSTDKKDGEVVIGIPIVPVITGSYSKATHRLFSERWVESEPTWVDTEPRRTNVRSLRIETGMR